MNKKQLVKLNKKSRKHIKNPLSEIRKMGLSKEEMIEYIGTPEQFLHYVELGIMTGELSVMQGLEFVLEYKNDYDELKK